MHRPRDRGEEPALGPADLVAAEAPGEAPSPHTRRVSRGHRRAGAVGALRDRPSPHEDTEPGATGWVSSPGRCPGPGGKSSPDASSAATVPNAAGCLADE